MTDERFRTIGATTYLCPTPTVLVGCAEQDGWKTGTGGANLVTVAWTGICCTKPPVLSISLRPERHSHGLILRSGEFTVNLVGEALLYAMDFCGVKSGREVDKFAALGLTAMRAEGLNTAPALMEAPAYLSCRVRQVLALGSHDLFLADIVEVCVNERYIRADGSLDETAMRLIAHVHGKYRVMGAEAGFFGFSVAGEKALRRRAPYLYPDGRPEADTSAGAGDAPRRKPAGGSAAGGLAGKPRRKAAQNAANHETDRKPRPGPAGKPLSGGKRGGKP
ncbi:MAG: flavin reductase family protein [Clostridiales bacterium]|nr:flavin reductase family protein [Clostridiales bacterium]